MNNNNLPRIKPSKPSNKVHLNELLVDMSTFDCKMCKPTLSRPLINNL
ncbi:Uncharacterized protein ChrSV_4193 [Chromobacterium vaccinii]|nr:Uncharacterized protein ChrSW_4193 [Chromobacterium vaccinii]QND91650.1 Uncharacterized protein ChrSV_4193 [Chromobacterium vaccinii]